MAEAEDQKLDKTAAKSIMKMGSKLKMMAIDSKKGMCSINLKGTWYLVTTSTK